MQYINNRTVKFYVGLFGKNRYRGQNITLELVGYDEWVEGEDRVPMCGGCLVIKINYHYYLIKDALISGGCYYYDEECEDYIVEQGDWLPNKENFPEECIDLIDEIMELVNKNIPKGCCGGCT